MKYRFSLSLITQFQASQAAATKCATVILLQHSLIKTEMPDVQRGQPEKKKNCLIFAHVASE